MCVCVCVLGGGGGGSFSYSRGHRLSFHGTGVIKVGRHLPFNSHLSAKIKILLMKH